MDRKQKRFEDLLDSYAIAYQLTWLIMDSGILEQKIKTGNDVDKINNVFKLLMPSISAGLRQAERRKDGVKSTENYTGNLYNFASAVDIANAYFAELESFGHEWEYADLEDLFIDYKEEAEKQADEDRDRW